MHDYRQLAMDFLKLTWAENQDNLTGRVTDDFLYESPLTNARGVDWYRDFIDSVKIGFSNIEFKFKQVYARDNTACAYYVFEGVHDGAVAGIEANYNKIIMEAFAYFEFEEDKVRYQRVIFDTLELKNQMLKS